MNNPVVGKNVEGRRSPASDETTLAGTIDPPSVCCATQPEVADLAGKIDLLLQHNPPLYRCSPQEKQMGRVLLLGAGYFGLKHLLNIVLMQNAHQMTDFNITVVSAHETTMHRAFFRDPAKARAGIEKARSKGHQVARALGAFNEEEAAMLSELWHARRISLLPNQSDQEILALLGANDFDAVFIATPADTHFKYAQLALQKGTSVFLEKPFTTQLDQAQHLVDIARRKNCTLHVDNINLYDVNFILVKQLLDLEVLGEIASASYSVLNYFQHLSGRPHTILEEGIHATYVLMYLFGEDPLDVRRLTAEKFMPRDCDGSLRANRTEVELVLRGVPINFQVDLSYEPQTAEERAVFDEVRRRGSSGVERKLVIQGKNGVIELDFLRAIGRLRLGDREYQFADLVDAIDALGELDEFPLYNSFLHFYRRYLSEDTSVEEPQKALLSLAETLKLVDGVEAQVAAAGAEECFEQ